MKTSENVKCNLVLLNVINVLQLRRPRLYHGVCGLPQRMFEDGDHVIEGFHFGDDDFKSGYGQGRMESPIKFVRFLFDIGRLL